jgi:hypothetical protein
MDSLDLVEIVAEVEHDSFGNAALQNCVVEVILEVAGQDFELLADQDGHAGVDHVGGGVDDGEIDLAEGLPSVAQFVQRGSSVVVREPTRDR